MRGKQLWLVGVGLAGAGLAAWAGGGSVKLDQLPAAVKATIVKEAGTAKIEKVEKEAEPGKPVVYEAKWELAEDHDREVTVAEDGKLLSTEDTLEIKLEATPAPVKATLLKEAAGAAISEVEQATEGQKVTYEAQFECDGKVIEVSVAPDGKLLERQAKQDDDDEQEDGDDD